MTPATPVQDDAAAGEVARQAEVDSYAIVDTLEEQAYDDLTRLAAEACGVPIALITILDHDRNWFKSRIGVQLAEAPRESAFCEHLTRTPGEVMVVGDALADARFSANPMVVGEPHIRFYVGAPLVSASGHTLGAICAIDTQPRQLDAQQIETLQFLATQVMKTLDERRRALAISPTNP
jgi:GAF domain-containing protein